MKRAQILGQVFVLILAGAVFIMILLYGYKAISQFAQRSDEVSFINFESSLKDSVKQVSLDFGSVKRLDLSLPSKFLQLCVFCSPDLGPQVANCAPTQTFQQAHQLLYESWKGGSQNVFLMPLADTPLLVDRVEAAEGGFCMPVTQGRVSLRLEGRGDRALVGPWPQSNS
jgi:hypothetical protein